MRKLHVVVVPFSCRQGEFVSDTPLAAKSEEVGIATAKRIAYLFDGVCVLSVLVDAITGDASDVTELFRIGDAPDLDQIAAAA